MLRENHARLELTRRIRLAAIFMISVSLLTALASSQLASLQQKKPLTEQQIIDVLHVKGKTLAEKNRILISEVKQRGVNFNSTDDVANKLKNENGASPELLQAIRANYRGPSVNVSGASRSSNSNASSTIVWRAQEALIAAGYDAGTPNGEAGTKTVAAIREFQTDKGIPVSGKLDDETLTALGLIVRNQLGMIFVYVPAGSFMMGSNNGDTDEKPVHQVTIREGFYMGRYEVTQKEWQAVMGNNPSCNKGDDLPVEVVSWKDAQEFIQRLNARGDGFVYRLPTEAEWEYAARAGTRTNYYWGDDVTQACRYANVADQTAKENNPGLTVVECRDGYANTSPVGSFQPNGYGLYDMGGNVSEWCEDWYHDSYNGAPVNGSAWISGGEQKERVLRGGDSYYSAVKLRSARRATSTPDYSSENFGLRVVAVARQ